eukprot:Gb_19063 [translate_table: standard]
MLRSSHLSDGTGSPEDGLQAKALDLNACQMPFGAKFISVLTPRFRAKLGGFSISTSRNLRRQTSVILIWASTNSAFKPLRNPFTGQKELADFSTPIHCMAVAEDYYEPRLDSHEEAAVYNVLKAINPETDWKSSYPGNLCMGGPHGIVCDIDKEDGQWHIVELNLGWVSDYANNPSCSSNASFSPSIAQLPRLRKLFFYKCFTNANITIPSYLWSLGNHFEELVFQENPSLHGFLPSGLGNLVGLRRLIFSGTRIGGGIPVEIGHLKEIQQLVLSRNGLNGSIPSSVGELQNMVILDLSRNQLVGPVPEQFGGLQKISKIDLSSNGLGGILPDSLGQLGGLELMDLSYNNFSGGIPIFVSRMSSLRDLHLSGNPMGGLIPDFWDKLSGLLSLGLSKAGLVGRIPESLCALKNLTYLALDNNRLLGSIPMQFGSFPGIYQLDLSRNKLTGVVPFSSDFLGKMGNKLQLVGNPGLCFDPEIVIGLEEIALNFSVCDEAALAESIVQEKHQPMLKSVSTGNKLAHTTLHIALSVATACITIL